MTIAIEERIQMKKDELKKQFVSIYVGALQAIGIIIYCILKKDEVVEGIDWFYAFIFALGALSGTFIFTSVFNLLAMMKEAGKTAEPVRNRPSSTVIRTTRPAPQRTQTVARKREKVGLSETPYEEDDVPPPDDEEGAYYEEPAPVRKRKQPGDNVLE